jgi:predicted amidophosphoribosyltransferase
MPVPPCPKCGASHPRLACRECGADLTVALARTAAAEPTDGQIDRLLDALDAVERDGPCPRQVVRDWLTETEV